MMKLIMHKYRTNHLFKHLVWLVAVKIILLMIIWMTFIKPNKVHPSFFQVTDHMIGNKSVPNTHKQHHE
jgi:hypothetical protein